MAEDLFDKIVNAQLNIILVKGKVEGAFFTYEDWTLVGSKRALTEYVTKRYYPETDIRFVTMPFNSVLFLEKQKE